MTTKLEIMAAARNLGRMLADPDTMADFYDVVEPFIKGYADGLAAERGGWPDRSSLLHDRLVAVDALRRTADTVTFWTVDDARDARMTWEEIGTPLDVSKQAAQQKYGK